LFVPDFLDIASNSHGAVEKRLPIYLGLFYVVFVWGLNTVLVKIAIAHVDALAFTALRFATMAPLALLWVHLSGARLRFERRDWLLLLASGACGFGIYQYFWVIGLSHTTAFASSLLGSTTPIFTMIYLVLLGWERVRSARWIGAGIALVGVAIFEGAFAGRATFRIGDALTILAAMTFAGFNVVSAKLAPRYHPVALLAATLLIGTAMILPGGIGALIADPPSLWPPLVWYVFAFAVVFPIVLTYPVWSTGIARIGAARVALFSFLVPIVSGVLSIPMLHAHFAAHQLFGAAICLVGLAIATLLGHLSVSEVWAQRAGDVEH